MDQCATELMRSVFEDIDQQPTRFKFDTAEVLLLPLQSLAQPRPHLLDVFYSRFGRRDFNCCAIPTISLTSIAVESFRTGELSFIKRLIEEIYFRERGWRSVHCVEIPPRRFITKD